MTTEQAQDFETHPIGTQAKLDELQGKLKTAGRDLLNEELKNQELVAAMGDQQNQIDDLTKQIADLEKANKYLSEERNHFYSLAVMRQIVIDNFKKTLDSHHEVLRGCGLSREPEEITR